MSSEKTPVYPNGGEKETVPFHRRHVDGDHGSPLLPGHARSLAVQKVSDASQQLRAADEEAKETGELLVNVLHVHLETGSSSFGGKGFLVRNKLSHFCGGTSTR